jgi:hypothetical protein
VDLAEIAVDLLMNAAQRGFARKRFQPSGLGVSPDLIFPGPNLRHRRLFEAELNSFVDHRAPPRARQSAAGPIKPKRFGRIGGDEVLYVSATSLYVDRRNTFARAGCTSLRAVFSENEIRLISRKLLPRSPTYDGTS